MNAQTQGVPSPFSSKTEQDLLKKYFKGTDDVLFAMRAVMLDISPSDSDKELVKSTFADKELLKVIKYRFLPRLSKDVQIGQVQDIWLGIDQQITGQSRDTIEQVVGLNEQSIEFMREGLERLENPDVSSDAFSAPKSEVAQLENDPLATNLLARNRFIRAVETQLISLKTTANQVEQPADGASKNSSR